MLGTALALPLKESAFDKFESRAKHYAQKLPAHLWQRAADPMLGCGIFGIFGFGHKVVRT